MQSRLPGRRNHRPVCRTDEVDFKHPRKRQCQDEARFLQSCIAPGAKVVVLDERGKNISSPELAGIVENWMLSGCSEICFLIGGADGHLDSTRQKADLLLSFGRLTLPHILMRAVLVEQIYRIETIIGGHPYHRA